MASAFLIRLISKQWRQHRLAYRIHFLYAVGAEESFSDWADVVLSRLRSDSPPSHSLILFWLLLDVLASPDSACFQLLQSAAIMALLYQCLLSSWRVCRHACNAGTFGLPGPNFNTNLKSSNWRDGLCCARSLYYVVGNDTGTYIWNKSSLRSKRSRAARQNAEKLFSSFGNACYAG